ncbi:glycosyltransferase [Actinomarinicola tropica]|uniref:glycosyltransferase n=1 Tax=Actinomarinicola tropica TaxID=2789776 RepID=UPI001E5C8BAA|nr:glycosyltransferase [Actinomarinicola tropica]
MVVVALVPAFNAAPRIAATVRATAAIPGVARVLVVDDASSDGTVDAARSAGAEVLQLPANRGKGGAVLAGVAASPDADVFLLVDADLQETAAETARLLPPVLAGEADMTIAVLPPAAGRGGFGKVRDMATRGIRRASGFEARAPLSGQRAVRADLLRGLESAERFGLEVALTIDAVRAGARVQEVEAEIEHLHTGRSLAGFRHRGRQGADIVRALWPRLVGGPARAVLLGVLTLAVLAGLFVGAEAATPTGAAATTGAERVVVVGVAGLSLDDLDAGIVPEIDALWRDGGALSAASVRTLSSRPSTVEAWATLGAGSRVRANLIASAAYASDTPYENTTAGEVTARRTGSEVTGQIAIVNTPLVIDNAGDDVPSLPGSLGDALTAAGLRTATVGNADRIQPDGDLTISRPAAVAVMRSDGFVDHGAVGPELLREDPSAPFGTMADTEAMVATTLAALEEAHVVTVDPGDLDRLRDYDSVMTESERDQLRSAALTSVDTLVGELHDRLPEDTLLLVVGLTPPTSTWSLTPMVASGAGVRPGYLHSPSTQRTGLVTLTDVAPTVLDAIGADIPADMIGAPLRYQAGSVDLDRLQSMNDTANGRERIYYPIALTFIVVQALGYAAVLLVLRLAPDMARHLVGPARILVLTFAAWPLATFLLRLVPSVYRLGGGAHVVLWLVALAIALAAARVRRRPLVPLALICGLTVLLLLLDMAFGAPLQMSSLLGYSPHTAARFTGFGNTTFAVFGACAVVAAALHVHHAPRRRDALAAAGAMFLVVLVADGAPQLGADVGGILTYVPVFALTLWALAGRRISMKVLVLAGVATLVVLALAVGLDLLRDPDDRSHLARFVLASGDDQGNFWTTISRKWATNLRVLRQSIWAWMVPIIAVFALYVLVVARGWRRLLPMGSAVRAAVIGTLATGVLGWLVNDSGVVVAALAFVYLGPLLTLLALSDSHHPAVLHGPRAAAEAS